jgi:hypothetical protein
MAWRHDDCKTNEGRTSNLPTCFAFQTKIDLKETMKLSEINSIQIFVSFVGAVLVAFLANYLSNRRERFSLKRKAALEFRNEVLTTLTQLYPLASEWPKEIDLILRAAFPSLQRAVSQFRPFVPFCKRWSFDRAWFRYRCGTGREIDVQNYHHYMAFGSNPNGQENFKRNVDSLLKFANF